MKDYVTRKKNPQTEINPLFSKNKKNKTVGLIFFILMFVSISLFAIGKIKHFLSSSRYVVEIEGNPQIYPVEIKWGVQSIQDVINKIKDQTIDLVGTYGWYVIPINNSNLAYGNNYNQEYLAASVNKIPILAYYLQLVESGKYSLDDIYVLTDEDKEEGSGGLQYKKAGTKYSYRELIEFLGKQSDNTSSKVIADLVGRDNIQKFINNLNMPMTNLKKNTSSPKDMAELFLKIYQKEIFNNPDNVKLFFDVLTNTNFETRIPAGVPENIVVSHKIGNQVQTWNDCGVILSENPYVLCVMTKETSENEAKKILPIISGIVWEYQSQH